MYIPPDRRIFHCVYLIYYNVFLSCRLQSLSFNSSSMKLTMVPGHRKSTGSFIGWWIKSRDLLSNFHLAYKYHNFLHFSYIVYTNMTLLTQGLLYVLNSVMSLLKHTLVVYLCYFKQVGVFNAKFVKCVFCAIFLYIIL